MDMIDAFVRYQIRTIFECIREKREVPHFVMYDLDKLESVCLEPQNETNELKDLRDEVENLEATVEDLENEVADLENELAELKQEMNNILSRANS
jgi:peptidoglycan hydrolase CwlO-like protein